MTVKMFQLIKSSLQIYSFLPLLEYAFNNCISLEEIQKFISSIFSFICDNLLVLGIEKNCITMCRYQPV